MATFSLETAAQSVIGDLDLDFEYESPPPADFSCCVMPDDYDDLVKSNRLQIACVGRSIPKSMQGAHPVPFFKMRGLELLSNPCGFALAAAVSYRRVLVHVAGNAKMSELAFLLQRFWSAYQFGRAYAAAAKDSAAERARHDAHWKERVVAVLNRDYPSTFPPNAPIANLIIAIGMRLVSCGVDKDDLPHCFSRFKAPIFSKGLLRYDEARPRSSRILGFLTSQPALIRCTACAEESADFVDLCFRFSDGGRCWSCYTRHKSGSECSTPEEETLMKSPEEAKDVRNAAKKRKAEESPAASKKKQKVASDAPRMRPPRHSIRPLRSSTSRASSSRVVDDGESEVEEVDENSDYCEEPATRHTRIRVPVLDETVVNFAMSGNVRLLQIFRNLILAQEDLFNYLLLQSFVNTQLAGGNMAAPATVEADLSELSTRMEAERDGEGDPEDQF